MSAEPTPRPERSFSPALFAFLRELREHNEREWFTANKRRYEEHVREPAFAFISAFAPLLARISPHFVADSRPAGGSLFRIYRDTRFSRDKTPYKTHTGIHFRHEQAKDVHAPGFYLHLEPGAVFAGTGIWRPEGATLGRIRDAIAGRPDEWLRAVDGIKLAEAETLKRAPAGYDADHPLIDDLKRKGFVAVVELDEATVTSPGFAEELADRFQTSAPLMRFLCDAVEVPF